MNVNKKSIFFFSCLLMTFIFSPLSAHGGHSSHQEREEGRGKEAHSHKEWKNSHGEWGHSHRHWDRGYYWGGYGNRDVGFPYLYYDSVDYPNPYYPSPYYYSPTTRIYYERDR